MMGMSRPRRSSFDRVDDVVMSRAIQEMDRVGSWVVWPVCL